MYDVVCGFENIEYDRKMEQKSKKKKSLSIKLDHVWKKKPHRWKSPLKVEIPRHIIKGNNRFLKSFIIANCYNNIFGYLKRLKHYKHLNIMKYLKMYVRY